MSIKITTQGNLNLGPILEEKANKVSEPVKDESRNAYTEEIEFYTVKKLEAQVALLTANNQEYISYIELKKVFFWITSAISVIWVIGILAFIFFKVPLEKISTTLLVSILITGTGNMLGLYYIIANHLFPKSGMHNNSNNN